MTRDEILAKLKMIEPDLRRRGVAHLALFGSMARGDNRSDSDIDILVEFAPEARVGLFEYSALIQFLADLFPTRVDVAHRDGLKPFARPRVEADAIYAF